MSIVSPILAIMAGMRRMHLINFARTMAFTTLVFLAPLRFIELGFDGVGIGFVVALLAAAPIVFAFPTGWLNDRVSMKKVMLGGLLDDGRPDRLGRVHPRRRADGGGVPPPGIANNAINVSINSFYYKHDSGATRTASTDDLSAGSLLGLRPGLLLGSLIDPDLRLPHSPLGHGRPGRSGRPGGARLGRGAVRGDLASGIPVRHLQQANAPLFGLPRPPGPPLGDGADRLRTVPEDPVRTRRFRRGLLHGRGLPGPRSAAFLVGRLDYDPSATAACSCWAWPYRARDSS